MSYKSYRYRSSTQHSRSHQELSYSALCPHPSALRFAFTLVELMVVIVIIGLLAGAVTFSVKGYLVASKQNVAKMDIAKITQALETFYTQEDRYPNNQEGLALLAQPSKSFPEGILTKVPQDPWGNPYQYNHPGRSGSYDVLSLGADKREGGAGADADITNEAE